MCFLMSFAGCWVRESFAAVSTAERFLSRVDSHVPLKVASMSKFLPTVLEEKKTATINYHLHRRTKIEGIGVLINPVKKRSIIITLLVLKTLGVPNKIISTYYLSPLIYSYLTLMCHRAVRL